MSVPMGHISCGNSALCWPATMITWGRTAELKNSALCRLCVQMLFKEQSGSGSSTEKQRGKQFLTRLPVCSSAAAITLGRFTLKCSLPHKLYFRLISFMGRAVNKREMSWMLFSAGEKCYYRTLTPAATLVRPVCLFHIIILPPSTVGNNNKPAIHRLPLSQLIVQSWNEKNPTKFCLSLPFLQSSKPVWAVTQYSL